MSTRAGADEPGNGATAGESAGNFQLLPDPEPDSTLFFPRYLFVFSEGEAVFSISGEPTGSDLEHAASGLGTIIRLTDLFCYGRNAKWEAVTEGRLGRADIDGEPSARFHGPASYFEAPP